jgi:hypothetical protein
LSVNVTPLGRVAPPSEIEGVGYPVVDTVNVPAEPTVNVVLAALVIAGAAGTFAVIMTSAPVEVEEMLVPVALLST